MANSSENRGNSKTHKIGSGRNDSALKIVIWTVLFQLAWHFRSIMPFLQQGTYNDSDDFLRLNQIRSWMAGQGWYNVSVPRMNLPDGGDMHWSRLVDVPIAALIWFSDLFTDTIMAERLASIVWPTLLLIATVFVLIKVCKKLFPETNGLLTLMFIVTCIAALVEFAPSRIDHHSVQIFFYCLTLLGLVHGDRSWGHYLIGFSIAFSLMIGLDVILLLVFILGWLGLEWASGLDENGIGLRRTAISMTLTALILYPVNVAPSQWFVENCDAISIVYLVGLVAVSLAFIAMSVMTGPLSLKSKWATTIARIGFGGLLAVVAMAVLYSAYPQCSAGPLSGISPELKAEWLSQIVEAKGLLTYVREDEAGWIGMPTGMLFVLGLGAFLLEKKKSEPRLLAILAAVFIVFVLGFIQVRAYRIGMFAIVPICVIIAQTAWAYFSERYKDAKVMAIAATALLCAMLMTPVWLLLGAVGANAFGFGASQISVSESASVDNSNASEALMSECKAEADYQFLASLPEGYILNAIDLGPVILVFTHHSVVGGNYHRNAEAILDTRRFFSGSRSQAKEIIERRNPDYVAMCKFVLPDELSAEDQAKFGVEILQGKLPDWLELISPENDALLVYRYLGKN